MCSKIFLHFDSNTYTYVYITLQVISIENSVFEKNVYENPVASVMNIFEGVLMVRVKASTMSRDNVSDVLLNIKGLFE